MRESEQKNARIKSTHLGNEDHGILTCFLHLEFDSGGQGFGGYSLDQYDKEAKRRIGTAYGMEFIAEILRTLEVTAWEKLPGTHCRIIGTWSKIEAIGHIIKDQWFRPDELLVRMRIATRLNPPPCSA